MFMSTLNFSDVDQILRIVDQFPAAEVRFEHGDLKLYVKRAGSGDAVAQPAVASNGSSAPPALPATSPAAAPAQAAAAAKPVAARSNADRSGQTPIESPLMGVYYAAPAPDADPFVRAGQKVTKSTTLCIIEVMKVMNDIRAPCAGVVIDIAAENGAMVEQGQALMWIKPEGRA
jgi:acetyl-CoA carboxylase biotin carboxyl carrier protein